MAVLELKRDHAISSSGVWPYFDAVSEILENDFWKTFDETQHILVALGGPYEAKENIRSLWYEMFLSIYSNSGSKRVGFVYPKKNLPTIDHAYSHVRIPRIIKSLREEYQFTDFTKSDLHQALKRFVKFYCLGVVGSSTDKTNEAFLHYAIGLEIIFSDGKRKDIQDCIRRRLAALLCKKSAAIFDEKDKQIKKLYNLRSEYVHEGNNIAPESVLELEAICKVVLDTMLRLQLEESNHTTGFIDNWNKKLDALASAFKADLDIPEERFRECGIF